MNAFPLLSRAQRALRFWLGFMLLPLALGAEPATAKNFALLIGNSNYAIGQLDNPANDAQDFANVLRAIGFDTSVKTNQNSEQMKSAIRDFGEKLKSNDGIGLFFFAGHGVQVNGENYLLPVAFPFRNEAEVEKVAVPANMVLRYMEDAKNRVNVVVLDACRNNPFIKLRSLKTRGLAPMDAPSGSLVAFSTAPGTEASDGSGRNGLYTKHLMANVKIPGLTVEQVFKRTREGVEKESQQDLGRTQSPREESSLKGGDMYFVAPTAKNATGASAEQIELAYWNSIANSSNSADFESYLAQYPQGKFAELAKNRVLAAKGQKVASRSDARTLSDDTQPATRIATAKPGRVFSGAGGFSFSDDAEAPVQAAEFVSISCRDFIKDKRVKLQLADDGNQGAALRQAIAERLQSIGLRPTTAGAVDLVLNGNIEFEASSNRLVGLDQVDMQADLTLQNPAGKTLASASASGGAYAGSSKKRAARGVWDEKSGEIVGKLFKEYCAGH